MLTKKNIVNKQQLENVLKKITDDLLVKIKHQMLLLLADALKWAVTRAKHIVETRRARNMKTMPVNNYGMYRDSFTWDWKHDQYNIDAVFKNTAPYAKTIEYGTPRGTIVSVSALTTWAVQKFQVEPRKAVLIARSVQKRIKRYGVAPQKIHEQVGKALIKRIQNRNRLRTHLKRAIAESKRSRKAFRRATRGLLR